MAEYNNFTEDLQKLVTCVICNDILTEPKTLPCLHTFCFICIQSWNQTCQRERKPMTCPSCRAPILKVDVGNLPTSFQHNSLIQLYNSIKNKTSDQQQLQQCLGCSKRCVVVGFCVQCEGVLCKDCMSAHKTMNLLKDTHQATLWNEFKKENINHYIDYKSLCLEKFHEKCRLEFYCQTCKNCICSKCAATAHSTHEKISIEEEAEIAKQLIRTEKDRLNEVLKMYKKELQLSGENRDRIKNQVDMVKAKVRSVTQAKMKALQNEADAIIASLNDFLVDQTTLNDEEKNDLDASIQQALELRNQCQAIDDFNLTQFILEGHEKLEEVCKTTVKGVSILSTKPVKRNSSIRFIPNQEVIKSVQELRHGKIVQSVTDPLRCSIEPQHARCGFMNQINIMTRDTEGDICYTNKGSIDVQIQDIDGNDVHTELTESQTGMYVVKYKAQKPSPYKVVVSIGGKSISNSPQNVETIDAKAEIKPVRVFETTKLCKPKALVVSDTGEVAVVNHDIAKQGRVVLFSADGEYLRELGSKGKGESRLSKAFGVAFNDKRLLVTNDTPYGYGNIKEFDMHGNYKNTICKQKRMRFRRMCTTGQNIACLAYDQNSKETFLKFFSKQTDDQLQDIKLDIRGVGFPMFLAYDNNKYFVSFSEANSIFVFDENGGLLYKFGEEGDKEGQFNIPRGLAVFGADMLLVCDSCNHRVQLLSQDGQLIRSFGSHGSGLGQMDGPFDVVVTPDGQVFLLESDGRRVQVFR